VPTNVRHEKHKAVIDALGNLVKREIANLGSTSRLAVVDLLYANVFQLKAGVQVAATGQCKDRSLSLSLLAMARWEIESSVVYQVLEKLT
jgi:hypothetical protein